MTTIAETATESFTWWPVEGGLELIVDVTKLFS